jgi:hypothetical protein
MYKREPAVVGAGAIHSLLSVAAPKVDPPVSVGYG